MARTFQRYPPVVRYVVGDSAVFGVENDDDPLYNLEEKIITLSSYVSFNFSNITPVFPDPEPFYKVEQKKQEIPQVITTSSDNEKEQSIVLTGQQNTRGQQSSKIQSMTIPSSSSGNTAKNSGIALFKDNAEQWEIIQNIREQAKQRFGLNPKSFVFGCYSNLFKLDPNALLLFFYILKAIPNAYLLFIKETNHQERNIRMYVQRCGFESFQSRIVFLLATDRITHLSRLQIVDVFLDTPAWSGQWSSAEALYNAIPVLTMPSRKICTRLTTSMLITLNCQELIAQSAQQFLEIAIRLALDNNWLTSIRRKLAAARSCSVLFDVRRWTRELELAMETCYSQWLQTRSGISFDINDVKREQNRAVSMVSLTHSPPSVESILRSYVDAPQ